MDRPMNRSTENVLIIDGNSILNRAFYGVRALSTKDGQPTNALFGFVNIVYRQIEVLQPAVCVAAFDLKAPTFRHQLYDAYKAGRHETPPELLAQFAPVKELCRAMGFYVLEKEGYEADDMLGTVSAMAETAGMDCYLLTGDRDSLQLIGEHTHVLLATNTETVDYTVPVFREKYGTDPIHLIDIKALMGDSSDHIPGVPGIGEKTALKLIGDYGSLDAVYANLPTAPLSPSVRAKLEAGKDSAYLSYRLATIVRQVPIDLTLDDMRTAGINRKELFRLFSGWEFYTFIKRFALENEMLEQSAQSGAAALPSFVPTPIALPADALTQHFLPEKQLAVDILFDSVQLYDSEAETLYGISLQTAEERAAVRLFLEHREGLIAYDAKALYHASDALGISWRNCAFDAMLAAYVVSAGEGSYEAEKVALTYLGISFPENGSRAVLAATLCPLLTEKLKETEQIGVFQTIEMPLCAVLADMEAAGFHVDCEAVASYGERLQNAADQLESRIHTYCGQVFNINSPKQLGEVLFGENGMGLPAPKKGKNGYSTSAEVLEKVKKYHPVVEDILDYRQVTKLKSTYCDGLLRVTDADGQVHTNFKQTGTATGRLSSAEPNLQNIPVRTELGRELRRFFVPSKPGYVLIDADYSQIELRLLAAITQDENMCYAFLHQFDIHTATAATVFHTEADAVTSEMRKRAKAINFGILYGMGEFSLAEDLHISRAMAKEYIEHYLSSYPRIDQYLNDVREKAKEQGYVTTLFGRRRYIPELKSQNHMIRQFGERVAMNSPIQGSAADIIKIAMISVNRRLKAEGIDAKLILQVHDELILESAPDCATQAKEILQYEMEHAVSLAVPLDVSIAIGQTWYDAK